MKKLNNIKEFCEGYHENITMQMTVDEFVLIRSNLMHALTQLEYDIETIEWMNTPEEKHQLEELKRITEEMFSIPF